MRIAHIGLKGLPARYGGVERYVQEIALRQVRRGHRVTVFCRGTYTPPRSTTLRGIRLVRRPTPALTGLNNLAHTAVIAASLWAEPMDIVHFHGIGPALFVPLARAWGPRVVSTVHALDYRQTKWGATAQALLRAGERCAVRLSAVCTAVSQGMADDLSRRHGVRVHTTPPGAPAPMIRDDAQQRAILRRLGVAPGQFYLSVGRMIPDKGFLELVRAHRESNSPTRLVIAGAPEFSGHEHVRALRDAGGETLALPGFVYGADLEALYAACRGYVHASYQEGLPLVVLEAMAHGAAVIAADIPANREAAGDAALFVPPRNTGALARALRAFDADAGLRADLSERGRQHIRQRFDWERTTDLFESAYIQALRQPRNPGASSAAQ